MSQRGKQRGSSRSESLIEIKGSFEKFSRHSRRSCFGEPEVRGPGYIKGSGEKLAGVFNWKFICNSCRVPFEADSGCSGKIERDDCVNLNITRVTSRGRLCRGKLVKGSCGGRAK